MTPALKAATDFAAAHETPWPRDILAHLESGFFEPPPDNEVIGPTAPRGGPNGAIYWHGKRVAEWGDPTRADMTFSVAKSYLAILAGLAWRDGLLKDIDAPVSATVKDPAFEGAHNGAITWKHLLTNTSEWEGTLWGKSDLIDRGRSLGVEGQGKKRSTRPLQPPGQYWEYNDVRVNALALALLHLFRRPLPEIWAERIMKPIGTSDGWTWRGYRTSGVEIDGKVIESVSGGGHWGGGLIINAEDQAKVGLLVAADGQWQGREIIRKEWLDLCRTPCALNPHYGFLFWLNTGRTKWPSASEGAVCFSGAGGATTWMEPAEGIVAVSRWLDGAHLDEFMRLVRAALAE
ncbi:serine hydrolase domain-containing protein [Roseococcus sp. YIM B11640]|uniref:serine hydrolase domain-containing protein n=1 Tax=Roseococcus sp. YIM B11640 TaxID=3133973 RepID=UPI003C7AB517